MAFYEKKWWKNLFAKEEKKKVDALSDIDSIKDFLEDSSKEIKQILDDLKQLEELEKESHVAKEDVLLVNLETQAEVLDSLIKRYEFFQNDVDINGDRIKIIVKEFLHKADKSGLKDLVKEKKNDPNWKMRW